MSVSLAESRVASCRRDLERHRQKQAAEEGKAARLEGEAGRYDAQAGRASTESSARSSLRWAASKRADAQRAREAAAKASKAVADAQKKLHEAEAALAKERAREEQKVREKARRTQTRLQREREVEGRRQRDRDRARDHEVARLRGHTAELEARLAAIPGARSPEEIDVLFVAASPDVGGPQLRLDREVREIQQRVRMSEHRNAVRFHWRLATQVTDLLQALNETRPHVVHFSGHGSQDALIFEDDDGRARPLTNADLAQLLRISSDRIRLALFNSCDSAAQAALACNYIDASIGMNAPVEDEAAKVFAGQFYNTLGFGKSLQVAFDQAELQVNLAIGTTGGKPLLHTAQEVDASSVYLVKPPEAANNATA
jgi:CHAT domain